MPLYYVRALDICCPNVWPQTGVEESMMPEKFWLFPQKGINLDNLPSIDHALFHHTKRVAYKDGHC